MNTLRSANPFQCKVEGNVVVLECQGPWDAASLNHLIGVMAPLKAQVANQNWGMLLVLSDDPFLLSDTLKTFIETVKKDKQNGRQATAIVMDDDPGYEMSKSLFEKVFRGARETHAFFETCDEAKKWLKMQLEDNQQKDWRI